jgi:microcystin-dependent protein
MSEPFLSEIKVVSFNFPPKGWALCNGQSLPINQNQALFALLGTTYGGNGQTTFNLPNLRGRVPIGFGGSYTLGEAAGETAHTITMGEMPAHNHFVRASSLAGDTPIPTGNFLAGPLNLSYRPPDNLTIMNPATISTIGGSQAHTNVQPYLVLNFIIALQGIFPSQN